MASMEEKIQAKRQRTDAFVASLPGSSKKVRVVTFTQAQLPKAHVTETGGLLGMVLFNDGQATFQQENTTFVRALLMHSNYPNIYNYTGANQYPQVPHWSLNRLSARRMPSFLQEVHGWDWSLCVCAEYS